MMSQPDMRPAAKVYPAGVNNNKLSPFVDGFLYLKGNYRMVFGGVGANGKDTSSIADFSYRVSHSAAAEACGQTGHSGRVSEAGTVVYVVGAHHPPCEFLENIVIFVGTLG
jgi:hypothetical protein